MDKATVIEWLKYASNDLDAATHLLTLHPLKLEIICYLCQQSAEKMLKAFWLYSDVFPPKTHDLELLRSKCEEFDASFLKLAGECLRLNDYSSQPRYPFNLYSRSERFAIYCLSFCRPASFSKLARHIALLRFDASHGGKNPAP